MIDFLTDRENVVFREQISRTADAENADAQLKEYDLRLAELRARWEPGQ